MKFYRSKRRFSRRKFRPRSRFSRRSFRRRRVFGRRRSFRRRRLFGRRARRYIRSRTSRWNVLTWSDVIKPAQAKAARAADEDSRLAWFGVKDSRLTDAVQEAATTNTNTLYGLAKLHSHDLTVSSDYGAVMLKQQDALDQFTELGNRDFGFMYFKAVKITVMQPDPLSQKSLFAMDVNLIQPAKPVKFRNIIGKLKIYKRIFPYRPTGKEMQTEYGTPMWQVPAITFGGPVGSRYKIKYWYKSKLRPKT